MPLYEYQCAACDQRFERIQKFSDPPVETCPSCGGKVRKLLSSPAIQFKGSGWYITDYARQEKKGGGDKGGDKGGGEKAASGGSEAKADTAAKSESSSAAASSEKSSAPATKSE